jgi:hypothetical protein
LTHKAAESKNGEQPLAPLPRNSVLRVISKCVIALFFFYALFVMTAVGVWAWQRLHT